MRWGLACWIGLWVSGGPALAKAPVGLGGWEVLQEGEVWIGCTSHEGLPWCKSVGTVPGALPTVAAVLENHADYPKVFTRVTSARVLEPNVVHVTLDMPFPLASRDYVVRFTEETLTDGVVYHFASLEYDSAPVGDAIRLVNAGGEWRLTQAEGGGTTVAYTWNGELRGDMPDFALPRAWVVQGNEVMDWLTAAVE